MRKVLWLSNYRFSEESNRGSGAWIEAMGKGLLHSGKYELYNVTCANVCEVCRCDACGVNQWGIPIKRIMGRPLDAMPPHDMLDAIVRIVDGIKPDLIHVWGTERFWGLLVARNMLKYPALLEMQGITHAMSPYMTGCLTQTEIRSCHRLKEWLKPCLSMEAQQRNFVASEKSAHEMYTGFQFIDCQSEWVRSYVLPYAKNAKLFKTRMILRRDYLESVPWRYQEGNHTVFANCGWQANKGLHTLLRACEMLKMDYPDIRLAVAGGRQSGIRRSGYIRWMMEEIDKSGVEVDVLGSIDPAQMIDAMHASAVFVQPSLVESYSMCLAEAMAVGMPCIASYAGAMPEVGGDACLYFPIADAGVCAGRIREVFESQKQAEQLGMSARKRSIAMHDIGLGIARQMEIYEEILNGR